MAGAATPEATPAVRLRRSPLVLVAVGGGVASGKSTVAARLAHQLDAVHVGSDERAPASRPIMVAPPR